MTADRVNQDDNDGKRGQNSFSTPNSEFDENPYSKKSSDPFFPSRAEVIERLENLWAGERPTVASTLPNLVGQRIGKYVLGSVVGHGAFGIVYQARDDGLARDVALKLARPEVLLDKEKRSRFESEARHAAALDHPLIVSVYEADFRGPAPFIASAFCSGPDLGSWLASRESPVPAEQAAAFVASLAGAVQYAHDQGVLHRDLKPSNILLEPAANAGKTGQNSFSAPTSELDETWHPKNSSDPFFELADYLPRLTDFGLAKLIESNLQDTRSSLLIGTPLYMAPEQLLPHARDVTRATDVYALGVLLYELLTLRTPFEGTNYIEVLDKLRTEEPSSLREVCPDAPRDLETICEKCLAKAAEDRYPSAGELRDDLERYLRGEPLRARPTTWRDRLVRWRRQPQRLVTAGRFTCFYQLAIIVWTLSVITVGLLYPIIPDEDVRKSIIDFCFVTLTVHLPKAWLGRKVATGSKWAFWPSAVSSALLLGLFIYGAFGHVVAFDYNYPTPHSKVGAFSALIMGSLSETALYVLAVPAWLRSRTANSGQV